MTVKASRIENPMDPVCMATLKHWGELPAHTTLEDMRSEATVDCGWGRLIFGQTFASADRLAREICREAPGRRDVALYIRDPHVVVALDPQQLFLDPSHTFRLPLRDATLDISEDRGWRIRQITEGADTAQDETAINRLYQVRGMVPVRDGFLNHNLRNSALAILVAETDDSGEILGVVTGVDHVLAFNDPDQGASLWSLAVDPQCLYPGIGASLVKALAAFFQARQRTYLDLSVMHDNAEAIALYQKLGFQRVPVYCVKHKNPINEKLFVGPDRYSDLNIYARIIIDEARRRGIAVDILDAQHGYFRLSQGGRSITCRESLCELTSAIAMSRCDDKRVTRNVLTASGLRMPAQILADDPETVRDFLAHHQRVVVKPARGEQGHGVQVDLRTPDTVEAAITNARRFCDDVIVEEMVDGEDLRIIVIGYQIVAAATRRPAEITGDGHQNIRTLIEKQSRRRQAATGGESHIPVDTETLRCIEATGYTLDSVLPAGQRLRVRKTANLHTGGTIHDVTDQVHPQVREVAEQAARALEIPVVGFDFMVPDLAGEPYAIIEANERPGLANHEPQPTAQRFVDLLFPHSRIEH
ncbi:MAG: N-acetylglutaminylglutamine synthetase [Gammaproteobacteria bacterium]|nr:N-acetylglutaminylglutamine synthetase [Gammaproteobacteria bacterium]HRX71506.1 N-acetylglutaminylglutamine synthetase [Candidatus Competibacteraceae bacterium]